MTTIRARRRATIAWLALAAFSTSARAAGPVRVTAVDPNGHPVAGAAVIEALRAADGSFVVDASAPALGMLDERGVLTPLPTLGRRTSRYAVVAPGRVAVLVPETTDGVTVRLDPAPTITGTLLDERGMPTTDVTLRASEAFRAAKDGSPTDADLVADLAFRVVPDAAGAFSLSIAPAAELVWSVVRRDGRLESVPGFASGGTITVARGSSLAGRVFDVEGAAPAIGLEVILRPVTVARQREGDVARTSTKAPAPPIAPPAGVVDLAAIRARTDEGGRLRYLDVTPGVYEAELSDPTVAFDGEPPRIDASGVEPRRIETWWIRKRASVVGLVLDGRTRLPIEGASVEVAPPADAPVSRAPRVPPPSATGADGMFRLDGILPGVGYRLVVSAPGRAPVVETFDATSGVVSDRVQILLLPARTVRVTVVDAEARAVPGAEIRITPAERPEPDPEDRVSALFVRTATADAGGVAVVTGIAEGALLVRVRHDGFVDGRATLPDPGPSLAVDERVEMARRAAIHGVVRFADRPVDGVRVRGRGRSSGDLREADLAADGTFVLPDWGPEPVDVEATSTKASDGAPRGVILARRESVIAGSSEPVMLDVPALRRISGDVDGLASDAGTARVRLEVQRFDPAFDDVRWRVVEERPLAALNGHASFEFLAIPPGRFAVRALEGPRDTGPVDVLVDAGDVDGVSLRMPARARITGRVVDGVRFAAALGALVKLVRLEGQAAAPDAEASSPATITRDDGAFVFDEVAPGRYRVEAGDDGVASALAELSVREGESPFVPLRLEAGGVIEGVVSDADTRPLASVPVRVLRLPAQDLVDRTRTREDGGFRSRPLPSGTYRLVVEAGRGLAAGLEADVEVVAGQRTAVDLASHGDGSIEGVIRRRGTPVPGLLVEAVAEATHGAEQIVLRAAADAFGQYRFPGLAEGAYRLSIVDGAVRGTSAVRVRAGDRVARDLEVGEGRISGTVHTTKGDAVREAEILALPDPARGADAEGRVRTAPDGTFSIAGLPVGRYRLLVTPPGRPTRVVEGVFADLAGREATIDVVVGRGARLELTVVDDRRRTVAGADVWIEDAKGVTIHPRAFRTGSLGRLVVDGLPEGRCFLRVNAPAYGRAGPVAVDLRDGNVSSAEVTVRPAGAILLTVRAGYDPRARARVDLYRMPGRVPIEARRTLRRPDEPGCFGVTGRTGVLRLDDLEEGSYLVVVSAGRDQEELRLPVYVRAGGTEPITGMLRPAPR